MRNKKILTVVFTMCLLVTMSGYAFADGFSDVQGHWAAPQINQWVEKGFVAGYPDGTFKPEQPVTRAEFVALVNRAFEIENANGEAGFTDVAPGQWHYEGIIAAKAAGYISGYPDGTFQPDQSIARQEAASILVRLLGLNQTTEGLARFTDAEQFPAWSRGAIGALTTAGILSGYPDGTFNAVRSITRAEAVTVLDKALNYKPVAPPDGDVVEGAVEGVVTLDGQAVSSAIVRVFEADSYKVLKETTTGSNGKYKVELEPGDYDITASTANEVATAGDVNVKSDETTTTDLALEAAAVVSGVLKDKNGTTVKNTSILFTTNPTFVAKTDSRGEFTAQLLPDREYTVRAYDPTKKDAEPQLVTSGLEIGAAGKHDIGTLNAPFTVTSGGGGGGGGGGPVVRELLGINITPDFASLTIAKGESVTLEAVLNPANTTQRSVYWDVISGVNIVSLVGEETLTATITGNETGQANVKVASTVKSSIYDTIEIRVVKVQEIDVQIGIPADLDESAEPVKVIATVTVGGEKITLAVVLPNVPPGTAIQISEPADAIKPDLPFIGFDLTFYDANGAEWNPGVVTVELPIPEGLEVDEAGAFHYNGNVWEFREAAIVDGKLVFTTTLSPVAVTKKVPAPTLTVERVDNVAGSVTLSWTATADIYNVFRNDIETPIATVNSTSYTDEGLQAGSYTYYVKAYRGETVKFESAPSNEVTVDLKIAPKITKFAGSVVSGDTINVSLSDIHTTTGVEVSMDSKLALNVEGLGFIGQLSLKAGENNIDNILIPNLPGDADIEDLDLDKLYAVAQSIPADIKAQILEDINSIDSELKDNIEAVLDAIEGKDISEIIDRVKYTIDSMKEKGITRAQILDAIDFAAIDKAELFDWLSPIDGNPDVLTVEAILVDANDADNTNTYTIEITNN